LTSAFKPSTQKIAGNGVKLQNIVNQKESAPGEKPCTTFMEKGLHMQVDDMQVCGVGLPSIEKKREKKNTTGEEREVVRNFVRGKA